MHQIQKHNRWHSCIPLSSVINTTQSSRMPEGYIRQSLDAIAKVLSNLPLSFTWLQGAFQASWVPQCLSFACLFWLRMAGGIKFLIRKCWRRAFKAEMLCAVRLCCILRRLDGDLVLTLLENFRMRIKYVCEVTFKKGQLCQPMQLATQTSSEAFQMTDHHHHRVN